MIVEVKEIKNWLQSLETSAGKYKLSRNAFHQDSLDATSLAIDLKNMLIMEQTNIQSSVDYFNKHQDSSTGFFHEPFVKELDLSVERILEMSGTYLGYQVSAILMELNLKPKFHFRFYEQFLKIKNIKSYMSDFMPWEKFPMGAGNMCDHGVTMMRMNIKMGFTEYYDVIEKMYDWFEQNQNKKTGLWGSPDNQGKNGLVQAGYHLLRGTYLYDKREVKYIEKILDTVIESIYESTIFKSGCGEGCHDMDHLVLLEQGLKLSNGYRENEVKSIAARRLEQLIHLRKADGGFSFEAKNSIRNHNRYNVTPGLAESDLVGTVFYLETILRINRILGIHSEWKSSATHGIKDE